MDVKSLAQVAYLKWQADEELERQRRIVEARDYLDGRGQDVFLDDRLKEFLRVRRPGVRPNGTQLETTFYMNICRPVLHAVSERLAVTGFQSTDDALAQWAHEVWTANRMDARQSDVFDAVLRDGEAFIVVDWHPADARPRLVLHPRYTDPQVDGDGFGCKMIYPDEDDNQEPLYAVKRWTENLENGKALQRMNRYFPDRVEKYYLQALEWTPYHEEGEPWPLPWVDSFGQPLGLPVIHFKNKGLRSELDVAIPLQNALNKTLLDLIASADMTGFRIFYALGFIPTTDGQPLKDDGSNLLKVSPAQVIGTTLSKTEADFGAIDPADLSGLLELAQKEIGWTAAVTDTPVSRFQMTAQVASEGTQKEYQEPLLKKVRQRQVLLGNAWEDVFQIARNLEAAFGTKAFKPETKLEILWADPETRNEKEHFETLAIKREKLGVPQEQIWKEAGYTPEEIEAMKQTEEYQARLALLQMGLQSPDRPVGQTLTDHEDGSGSGRDRA